jgi:hypothetical protein
MVRRNKYSQTNYSRGGWALMGRLLMWSMRRS